MVKPKVFVSFDYTNDGHYKKLLTAWDANPKFDFVFADKTPDEINSDNIGVIKAALTKRIGEATHTLVIVGKYANSPHAKRDLIGYTNWINFEVAKSKAAGNKLVGIKIDKSYESPEELVGAGAKWAMVFKEEPILRALSEA